MSKSNVHPDHYKVAGRDRQGEDILQALHKQERAQILARERFETRLTTPAGSAPTSKPAAMEAPAAKQTERKKKATTTRGAAKAAVQKTAKTGARRASGRKPSVTRRTVAK